MKHNMVPLTKKKLLDEYVNNLKLVYMPLLKFGAFNRFDIKDGQIVSISKLSVFYSFIVILGITICGYVILLETAFNNQYLILPEFISVVEFMVLNTLALLNINLANRHSGAELIRNFIEIDAFLGIEQTKFMRHISYKDVLIWSSFILCFQVSLTILLCITFQLPIFIYITGFIFFTLLICMCYDHVFHVVFYKFLCLRVHYLNVALVKKSHLNTEYLMDQLLSYPFLWKKEYDDYVDFYTNADAKYFTEAFKMLFDQLQRLAKCYRFLIFVCMTSLAIGTFLAVQAIIIFIKEPFTAKGTSLWRQAVKPFLEPIGTIPWYSYSYKNKMNVTACRHKEVLVIRTFSLTGWFFVSWTIMIGITQQTDKFHVQIQRTKLICTYIQLKPNNSEEIFHVSRSILDLLSVSDYRISIYDLFYFNGSLLRSIASSVFVYITMQLQIAFPKRNDSDHQLKS